MVYFTIRVTPAMHRQLVVRSSDTNASIVEIIRQAIAQYLTRGNTQDYRHRELVLSGRSSTYPVDRILEWLLAKRPAVGDLMTSTARIDPRLKRVIKNILSEEVSIRVLLKFEGHNLETIGRMRGCSKQAIHASISRALRTLGEDRRFVATLVEITESDFSPDELMALAREI